MDFGFPSIKERSVLVGTYSHKPPSRKKTEPEVEDTVEELAQLAVSAGAEVAERIFCRLDRVNPRTYINRGKMEEIASVLKLNKAELVIFDDELSPSQNKNLESFFGVRTIDRRALILDIFAKRAQTSEGKLQVELAQLMYLMPRLTRMWTHLERQEGGIGTRGPGEKQLEMDRRVIRTRMGRIRDRLKKVVRTRQVQRSKRRRVPVPEVVLVGYTNSGKSTLFQRLTNEEVFAEDQLFATLDPVTRKIDLPAHQQALLTDSVGFIRKLPHELVEAFKATLEEVQTADLILHVIDASDPLWESHKHATEVVLEDLGAFEKPVIEVYNKIDHLPAGEIGLAHSPRRVFVSALRETNLQALVERIAEVLSGSRRCVRLLLPQGRGDLLALIHREGKILEEEYRSDYVEMTAILPAKRVEQWKKNGFVIVEQPSL